MINCVFNCLHAFLACAHRVIKVINKSGFITVALKSQNFCISCLEGFTLLMRNPLKFGLLAVLGEMFTLVGKFFVGILTACLGYLIITNFDPYKTELYSPFIPTLVSHTFHSVILILYSSSLLMVFLLALSSCPYTV